MAGGSGASTAIWVAAIGAAAAISTTYISTMRGSGSPAAGQRAANSEGSSQNARLDMNRPPENLSGTWQASFYSVTAEGARSGPILTFQSRVDQRGDEVEGSLVGTQTEGAFHCRLDGTKCRGSIRTIDDSQEWESLVLDLRSPLAHTIWGNADVMRSGSMQRFRVMMRR